MTFIILFQDNPDADPQIRKTHMPAHLAFLAASKGAVRAAGPLSDPETGGPRGGLWIVEAETVGEVEALIHADPFWPTGLRQSHEIRRWVQVFAEDAAR